MPTLHELLAEWKRRQDSKPADKPTPKSAGLAATSSEAPAEAWLAERSVNMEDLSPGELANVLEGLTPSGKDKRGRQVSFVEKGVDVLGNTEGGDVQRVSQPVQRIATPRRWWRH